MKTRQSFKIISSLYDPWHGNIYNIMLREGSTLINTGDIISPIHREMQLYMCTRKFEKIVIIVISRR